jgi:GMP synthase (glutamine-hydrolysing)
VPGRIELSAEVSVLVLQHIACEPPAAYREKLDERGIGVHTVELDRGGDLPSSRKFDAIIAMGGPMSVNDEATCSWLADEKRLIREFVLAGRTFWGVCLGAQLLASSLGARVYEGPEPEVGVRRVQVEEAGRSDPVFSRLPSDFLTLQWHGDTFDLPGGAALLASSPAYRHQAFRWKSAYGLQFHLEVSPELAESWGQVPAYAEALEEVMGTNALPRLLGELAPAAEEMRSHALELFGCWLDVLVASEGANRP